jgi:hypothetical protein
LGNYAELDLRILWSIKGSIEVEVGEVRYHILGPWRGEGAVDNQLDHFEGPRLGTTITGVVDSIATDGDAGSVRICFCWMYLADDAGVCNITLAIYGYVLEHYGLHCTCSCDSLCVGHGWVLAHALAESPNLICVGFVPCGLVLGKTSELCGEWRLFGDLARIARN